MKIEFNRSFLTNPSPQYTSFLAANKLQVTVVEVKLNEIVLKEKTTGHMVGFAVTNNGKGADLEIIYVSPRVAATNIWSRYAPALKTILLNSETQQVGGGDKILNPATGRMVNRSGAVGRSVLASRR